MMETTRRGLLVGASACALASAATTALPFAGERVVEFLAGHRDKAVLAALDARLTALGVRQSWLFGDWPPYLWQTVFFHPVRFIVMEADMFDGFGEMPELLPDWMALRFDKPALKSERDGSYWTALCDEADAAEPWLAVWRDCLNQRGQPTAWENESFPLPSGKPWERWPMYWGLPASIEG